MAGLPAWRDSFWWLLQALLIVQQHASDVWERHVDFVPGPDADPPPGTLDGTGFQLQAEPPTYEFLNSSVLRFEPSAIVLKSHYTCVPRWETVEIINIHSRAVVIESVSSDHSIFHPSLPKPDEKLHRTEVTKMQVLLLAQAEGQFEGNILVHTDLGVARFSVKATAVENPYKVSPIIGAKVVVGEQFSPPVVVYNPHSTDLRVREVFTTESFLHLTLPDRVGETGAQSIDQAGLLQPGGEHSGKAWTVPPKQNKTVIHISFTSHSTGNFKGFVHLKTDVENLLIPVRLTVTRGGVHVLPEVVDFQTLVSPLQSRSHWLTLMNMNAQPIELLSLYDPKQDPHLQITGFDQKGIQVAPMGSIRFAKVVYTSPPEKTWSGAWEEGFKQGKLQLIINDTDAVSATLDIPYKARLLYGSLGFMSDKTKFQSTPGKPSTTTRDIMISNNFSVPISIHAAKIDDASFKIKDFTPDTVLLPGEATALMRVQFTSNGTSALYTRDLELLTNVTAMKIPLQVYHGKLHCKRELEGLSECSSSKLDLDMGTISVTESRRKHINMTNLNPVNISIENITVTHASIGLFLEGVWGPKGEQVRGRRSVVRSGQSKRIVTLPPNHRLMLSVEVLAMDAGSTDATVTISTCRKETVTMRVWYESVLGSLAFLPATVRFDASFPGRVQRRTVAARSTFERPLSIQVVRSSDPRIIPELISTSLSPLARTEIAHIYYDPSKLAPASLGESVMAAAQEEIEWDAPLTEEIVERWVKRQRTWDHSQLAVEGSKGQTDIEALLEFDTSIVRGASLTVRAFLTKPVIARESTLTYDLTQVGTSVRKMLTIVNPSDTVLAVQLVFPLCEALGEVNSSCDVGFKLAPEALEVFHVKPHAEMEAGPIVFEPKQHHSYNTTLYLRNNLTMLQPLQLQGLGGSGRLVFPAGVLDFNLSTEDLAQVVLEDEGKLPRQRMSASKTFVAVNDCELPVEVLRMDIGGIPGCSGFGFEIQSNCPGAFTVAPHENASFRISFTPDFAASRWEQRLRLYTQSGTLSVPLRAFVPAELLPRLADRAPFMGEGEAYVKKVITTGSLVLCALMFVMVVSDSVKVYRSATASNGNGMRPDPKLGHSEMISLLSWSRVSALAPSSMWSSGMRRDHMFGNQRTSRRTSRDDELPPPEEHQPEPRVTQKSTTPGTHTQGPGGKAPDRGHTQPAGLPPPGMTAEEYQRQAKAHTERPAQQHAESPERGAGKRAPAARIGSPDRSKAPAASSSASAAAAQPDGQLMEAPARASSTREDDHERRKASDDGDRHTRVVEVQRMPRDTPGGGPGAAPSSSVASFTPAQAGGGGGGGAKAKKRGEKKEPAASQAHLANHGPREQPEQRRVPPQLPQPGEGRGKHGERAHQDEHGGVGERGGRDDRGRQYRNHGPAAVEIMTPSPKRKDAPFGKRNPGTASVGASGAFLSGLPKGATGLPPQIRAKQQRSAGGQAVLQGSVWADPAPAFAPQPQWAAGGRGRAGSRTSSAGEAPGTSPDGSPTRGKILPPPPSMPPPPAPKHKGGNHGEGSKHGKAGGHHGRRGQASKNSDNHGDHHSPVEIPLRHSAPQAHGGAGRGGGGGASSSGQHGGDPVVDRATASVMGVQAPIGPAFAKMHRPASSLLPDQEFIPINTDSPSLDRLQVFGDAPFAASLFSSPFAMFGPVTGYGGAGSAGGESLSAASSSNNGLLADLHSDSQPVQSALGRQKSPP